MVSATVSQSTVAKPVPGEALGGLSDGPSRFAVYVMMLACDADESAARVNDARRTRLRMSCLLVSEIQTNRLAHAGQRK